MKHVTLIREHSSPSMARSRMSGAAKRESSQVLWMTSVLWPPIMISLVYSSIARLLSPTYGTYLITTTWSGCSSLAYKMLFDWTISSTTLLFEIWRFAIFFFNLKKWNQSHFYTKNNNNQIKHLPLSIEIVAVMTNFCHHCCPSGCSLQLKRV